MLRHWRPVDAVFVLLLPLAVFGSGLGMILLAASVSAGVAGRVALRRHGAGNRTASAAAR